MVNNKIFISGADPNFTVKALADYCADRQQSYSNLMAAYTEVIGDEDADIYSVIDRYGFLPYQFIPFNNGYIKLEDFLAQAKLQATAIVEDEGSDNPITELTPAITLTNGKLLSLSDVNEQFSSSLHAIVSMTSALKSYASDASDKLGEYRDKLSQVFRDPFDDISATSNYYASLLTKKLDPVVFIQSVISDTGINELADDDTYVPENSGIYNLTGASPAGPLNFSNVGAAIGSVVNIAAKATAAVFKGVFSLVGSLFKKASNYVSNVVVNPQDIAIVDKDSKSHAIDGYSVISERVIARADLSIQSIDQFRLMWESFIGHKITIETIPMLITLEPTSVNTDNSTYASVSGRVIAKPRCINPEHRSFIRNFTGVTTATDVIDRFSGIMTALRGQPDLYLDPTDTNELDMLKGFVFAIILYKAWEQTAHAEAANTLLDGLENWPEALRALLFFDWNYVHLVYDVGSNSKVTISAITQATNKHFAVLVTGFNPVSDAFRGSFPIIVDTPYVTFSEYDVDIGYSLNLFLVDKQSYPLDYSFFPYVKDYDNPLGGRFRLKTDQENYEAFNNFLTVMITVVAVAAVAITVGVVVKKVSNRLFKKALEKKALVDSKMWAGEPVTPKEMRQYRRANKRLSLLDSSSKPLRSSSSDSAPTGSVTEDILPHIIGYAPNV